MGPDSSNDLFHASYVSGVDGTEWSVKYNPTEICVLKGSTVFINGTFTYPKDHEVTDTFWVIDPVKDVESLDLYKRTEFSGRIHYLGDKQQNFSFRLSNVTNDDQHMYCFRVSVNTPVKTDKYLYYPGVQLHITELHVNILPEVTERETAVLNCTTTCSLTDSPTLIWYKNGRRLSSNTNPLHLQPVSSEDAGSYMCAVRGYEHLPSPAQTLTVRCEFIMLPFKKYI
uniref:Ig-like domain-containing protein n=1 Tax=Electrophorus electricus TaxID=8005 RepID=A0AAY5EUC5_ELEEL